MTVRLVSLAALLLLAGCPAACPSEPLTPAPTARWAVRYNAAPPADAPPIGIPGLDEVTDPSSIGVYAAIALLDADGALLNERWVDGLVGWEGAGGTVDAATRVPVQAPGSLTLLLGNGTRSAVRLDPSTGGVRSESYVYPLPPEAGGQLFDLAPMRDGLMLASRGPDGAGGGGDLVVLDGQQIQFAIDLGALSSGAVAPGRVAALASSVGAETAVVGLSLPDEPDAGAVALVDLSGRVQRLDVPGLSRCTEVAALEATAGAPRTARVAVLCTGDITLPPSDRAGVGFVVIQLDSTGPARLTSVRDASSLLAGAVPTRGLAALDGVWVAAVAEGNPETGLPDVLVAVDLAGEARQVLFTEPWTPGLGPALGTGDFDSATGALLWPSTTSGVLRWQKDGASFIALANATPPGCLRSQARVVRHLPAP